ncbi:lipopolysaccharide-induced tumor necrosis factor-alpha factor homolog [Sebastes fasciatus]|uniref:lipopolysaccharide-induced tumor necrosis factor-alpha factor homolog n=1 Tax=Sebastes fasciatus TaxID=394691 RepID=UPI003D9E6C09
MEKGQDPPPPYPGLPMDNNVGVYQAQPGIQAQPGFQAQPGYQPSYQAQSVTYQYSLQQPQFVQPVSQVVVVQNLPEAFPGQMVCPQCQSTIVTKVKYKAGLCTWMICGIITLFGCFLFCLIPFCVIPFCVDDCKDVEHCCPNCERVLHVYKRR